MSFFVLFPFLLFCGVTFIFLNNLSCGWRWWCEATRFCYGFSNSGSGQSSYRNPNHFSVLSSCPILTLPLHPSFLCFLSFLILFSTVCTWVLRAWPQRAVGTGVRVILSVDMPVCFFFPSQTLPEPKPGLWVPQSLGLCVTLFTATCSLVPAKRGHCTWGSQVIRDQVSPIQFLLPRTYFIHKYKTIGMKIFCISVLYVFHLVVSCKISFLVLSAHL